MSDSKANNITALVVWLQSFPSFGPKICTDEKRADAQELFDLIGTPRLTRVVRHIASEICGVRPTTENDENRELSQDETIQIWASLYSVSTRMARPLPEEQVSAASMSQSDLKYIILSNLLDIVVNHPNMEMRRTYISRILKLSKHTQKHLMAMVDLRVQEERRNQKKAYSRLSTPPKSASKSSTPQRNSSSTHGKESQKKNGHYDTSTEGTTSTPKTPTTLFRGTPSDTTSSHKTSRGHTDAFEQGTSSGYTPASKRQNIRSPEGGFLSPGTMDSPQAIRDIIQSLQQKNRELSHDLALSQRRENEFKTKMDALKQNHRKEMIRLESASLGREQELKKKMENQNAEVEKKLQNLRDEVIAGRKAQADLAKARDQLDVMNHQQSEFVEMSERLTKYKEKMAELHDLREALKREQEAHSRSVEEIVQLDAEIKTLHPVKRQLEEYKIRAIEAEVKLVESQDCVRRLELHVQQASEASSTLFKETVLQKEQMNELAQRMKQESKANSNSNGKSVAEGVSELNPEIQQELLRLRGENLQLRDFAAKRKNDAVEKLESNLDDERRLTEQFKTQYLQTKDSLAASRQEIRDSHARERNLECRVDELQEEVEEAKDTISELQSLNREITDCCRKVESDRDSLFKENKELQEELQKEIVKLMEAFKDAREKTGQISQLTGELQEHRVKLEDANRQCAQFETSIHALQEKVRALTESEEASKAREVELNEQLELSEQNREKGIATIESLQKKLADTQAWIKTIKEEQMKLEQLLHEERHAHDQALQEKEAELGKELQSSRKQLEEERQSSNKALEATKEIMENSYKQKIVEQSENMNLLLDEERKATRKAREETREQIDRLEKEKMRVEQELEEKLRNVQTQLAETRAQLREESRRDVESAIKKTRKECDDHLNEIVRNGRQKIENLKEVCRKELEEVDQKNVRLEEDIKNLQADLATLQQTNAEEKHKLETKLHQSVQEINRLAKEADDHEEKYEQLRRDYQKIDEDNQLYRRRLGGRSGQDEGLAVDFENLQQEYNIILEENNKLRHGSLTSSSAVFDLHQRGSLSTVQLRREHEEEVSRLEAQRRQAVARGAATRADLEKSERRVLERDQQIDELKAQLTSLELEIERAALSTAEETYKTENSIPSQTAYHKQASSNERYGIVHSSSPPRSKASLQRPYSFTSRSSPKIDRIKREKDQQEQSLVKELSTMRARSGSTLNSFSNQSLTTSSPKVSPVKTSPNHRLAPGVSNLVNTFESNQNSVLSPTQKHEQSTNVERVNQHWAPTHDSQEIKGASAADLQVQEEADHSHVPQDWVAPATETEDGAPECNQS